MTVKTIVVGSLETNCYILIENKNALIIDPGDDFEKIKEACFGYLVRGILVAHHHFDHVGALESVEKYYGLKHNNYKDIPFSLRIIETKGHTSDSVTFYFPEEKLMFCGDFLFKGSFGRTDLGGNNEDMIGSLKLIEKYDDDILLYPGHGDKTYLGDEKVFFEQYKNYLN